MSAVHSPISTDVADDTSNLVTQVAIKPLASATYAPSVHTSKQAATSAPVKAAPGNVYSFTVNNFATATRFFGLYNSAAAVTAGAVPLLTFPVPANTFLLIDRSWFTDSGVFFSVGITWGASTSVTNFQPGASTDVEVQVIYK